MTLTTKQRKAVTETLRWANRVRVALGLPIRRKWRPGNSNRCPLETQIGLGSIDVPGGAEILVDEHLSERLREAGFTVSGEKDKMGRYAVEAPEEVGVFTELADSDKAQLPRAILGSWRWDYD